MAGAGAGGSSRSRRQAKSSRQGGVAVFLLNFLLF